MKQITTTVFLLAFFLISCQADSSWGAENSGNNPVLTPAPGSLIQVSPTPLAGISTRQIATVTATRMETPIATKSPLTATATISVNTPSLSGSLLGLIAFVAEESDKTYQIYVMDVGKNKRTQLTKGPWSNFDPHWSPNGLKILFQSSPQESPIGNELWVMNRDGTEQINLTNNPARDYSPTWSPDGQKIAFVSERDGNAEIYLMDTDGSNLLRLTNDPERDYSPAWSPDGQKIAFVSERDGNAKIYVIGIDRSGLTPLTEDVREEQRPVWAPNGTKIVFIADDAIWMMDLDNGNQQKISHSIIATSPFWSPDGQQIAFEGYENSLDYYRDVYLVDTNGDNLRRLTDNSQEYSSGPWAPDGNSLIIAAGPYLAVYDLFVIDVKGIVVNRVTNNLILDCCAVWQPTIP